MNETPALFKEMKSKYTFLDKEKKIQVLSISFH